MYITKDYPLVTLVKLNMEWHCDRKSKKGCDRVYERPAGFEALDGSDAVCLRLSLILIDGKSCLRHTTQLRN